MMRRELSIYLPEYVAPAPAMVAERVVSAVSCGSGRIGEQGDGKDKREDSC